MWSRPLEAWRAADLHYFGCIRVLPHVRLKTLVNSEAEKIEAGCAIFPHPLSYIHLAFYSAGKADTRAQLVRNVER